MWSAEGFAFRVNRQRTRITAFAIVHGSPRLPFPAGPIRRVWFSRIRLCLSLDPPNHIPELLSPVWTVPWVMWA